MSSAVRHKLNNIVSDYPVWSQAQGELLDIRTIKPGEVSEKDSVLVGQEGVFAKKSIKEGDLVSMFDGMLLEDPQTIELDKNLRQKSGCDKYFSRANSDKVIEGMGRSMKMNTSTGFGWQVGADNGNNLEPGQVQLTRRDNQEKLNVMIFIANRDIKAGEQLCFQYSPVASR